MSQKPEKHQAGRHLGVVLLLSFAGTACQAVPPPSAHAGPSALVRAPAPEQAAEASAQLESLQPRILATLPDSRRRELEVWIQASPALYQHSASDYEEADGFWSERYGRIHLREGAEDRERILAHELVHASLGESWTRLPGTVEEGLCDVVSGLLCPEQAPQMRAGRLSAAAFATGGMQLEVELAVPTAQHPLGVELGCVSRVRLLGSVLPTLDPGDVFEVEAGLSSTELPIVEKKVLYGLSYVLVERIVERSGFEGLHALCLRAEAEGLEEVPGDWLLDAADLHLAGRREWRAAIHDAIGDAELRTLLLLYPKALLDTVERVFGIQVRVGVDLSGRSPLKARVSVPGSDAEVDLALVIIGRPGPVEKSAFPGE